MDYPVPVRADDDLDNVGESLNGGDRRESRWMVPLAAEPSFKLVGYPAQYGSDRRVRRPSGLRAPTGHQIRRLKHDK